MIEPRPPLESEVNSLIGFLDKNLRPGQHWSIAAEYPTVFNSNNRDNLRIITAGAQVLAHAAIKYLYVKNTLGVFKVAAIGSVVTDPDFRNQGHSQKIMESCLTAAEKEGADFAVLWTDLYDFYRKLDFELAGSEISIVIDKSLPPPQDSLRYLKSAKVSPEAILRLYTKHTCATLRTVEDIQKSMGIPNTQVFTAWSPSNELLAYAVEGKGLDLKGYVHEWGGDVNHLLPLLSYVRQEVGMPITLISPAHATNLMQHLKGLDVIINHGYLGMIRPVSIQNIFFKLNRYARQLGINDLVVKKESDGFYIGIGSDVTVISSLRELTKLIFGPIDQSSLKPKFQKLLPIPMWMWGWDSI